MVEKGERKYIYIIFLLRHRATHKQTSEINNSLRHKSTALPLRPFQNTNAAYIHLHSLYPLGRISALYEPTIWNIHFTQIMILL